MNGLDKLRLVENKFRNIEQLISKAEKLASKYPRGSSKFKSVLKTLQRLRSVESQYYDEDRPEKRKRDLFRSLIKKSDDFANPLSKSKQKQFKGLMGVADAKDVEAYKKDSDTLASMKRHDTQNPHEHIKKVGPDHYSIHHPEGKEDYTLKKNIRKSHQGTDYWDLHHASSGDQAGEFQVEKGDGGREMKWSNIYSRFRGSKLSPKVYTTLSKHYGGIKSDSHLTLLPGRGVWMHLKRQGLHGVEPLKGKEAKSSTSRWEDYPEFKGDQRYSYKLPPQIKKNVEKKRLLDKSKVLPK